MQYSDLERMAAMRARKIDINLDVKPVDLFRAAAYSVASGEEHYEQVLILARTKIGSGYEYTTWRCGVTREQETTMLVVAQDINVRKMRGDNG